MAHLWKQDEVIASALLNDLEDRADKGAKVAKHPDQFKGPKGDAGVNGTNGISITAMTLTADKDGKITGGTATMSDKSTISITVTQG